MDPISNNVERRTQNKDEIFTQGLNTNENAHAGVFQCEKFIYDTFNVDFGAEVFEIDDFLNYMYDVTSYVNPSP